MSVDWHQRYVQQGLWTKPLRDFLLKEVLVHPTSFVLEVGCGTGVICEDFLKSHPCQLHGVDFNNKSLNIATRNSLNIYYTCGDAMSLPYTSTSFDIVFCHYFLLWVADPLSALAELFRVLRPGGSLLIFAEPDHASRIDFPAEIEILGKLQTLSLKTQGADVTLGRKLPGMLSNTGFENIQFGVSGFQITAGVIPVWWESEWEVITADLRGMTDDQEISKLRALDQSYWESGSRILWVPTFYASCKKPE